MSDREEHRRFLNRYYGVSRWFYDLTRRYYLIGRERALDMLIADRSWSSLIEIGPGTGRNLEKLHRARPEARLGGIEASDEMLDHARKKCPWAKLEQGFAEDADLVGLLGQRPDRILYSYCLTMVQEPERALRHARESIAPEGEVVVVDFGDLREWREPFRSSMKEFLRTFHVNALPTHLGRDARASARGRLGYWELYRYSAAPPT